MAIKLSQSEYNKLVGKKSINKKNKYNNKRIKSDGVSYDSNVECLRHQELLILEKSQIITDLSYHKKSNNLILQKNPTIEYEPDFCYYENGRFVVEDVKGIQTKEFILKKKIIIHKLNTKEFNFIFRITKRVKDNFVVVEEYGA